MSEETYQNTQTETNVEQVQNIVPEQIKNVQIDSTQNEQNGTTDLDQNGHTESAVNHQNGNADQSISNQNGHSETVQQSQNGHSESVQQDQNGLSENTIKIDPSSLEPEISRKVFIGSLNYSTTEDSLKNYFGRFGEILDSVIMKESKTGKSRGFGFITYTKSSMVDELQKARPHKLDGRELETKRATPREESGKPGAESSTNKLFVGAIKDGVSESDLQNYFGKYGKIEDCVIMRDKETNKLRGFGFITFDDYDPVDKIVLEKFHNVNGQSLAVKKALPKDNQNSQQNSNHKNFSKQNSNMRQNGRNNSQFNNGPGMFNAPDNFRSNNSLMPNNNAPFMNNMNMNNFAMFAQKMFEAAANNMPMPFNSNGMNNNMDFNGNGNMPNNGLFNMPDMNRRQGNSMPMNSNNRNMNFANDDFDGKY